MHNVYKSHHSHHTKLKNQATRESWVMANFVIFSPILWLGGWLCPPGQVPLILVRNQQNFLGPSRSAKNHLHWQQELLRNSRFAVFATFAIAKRKKQQKRPFLHNSNWTASILNVGHFFADLDGPKKFCWLRTKIKGTSPGGHNHPPTHKEGEKLQNWP